MKAGTTNIDLDERVVIIDSKNRKLLGRAGYIMHPFHSGVAGVLLENTERIDLVEGDIVIVIPEDEGKIMAGSTNIPVNERVKVIQSECEELIDMTGYITHPFAGLMAPGVAYAAGLYLENSSEDFSGQKCIITTTDVLIRYPR